MPNVNIALSLHSPFTEKRNELIPINKKYPLKEVFELVESIPQGEKRFATYEYLLIDGFNDDAADAHETGRLLAGGKAFVNLIPLHPGGSLGFTPTSGAVIASFARALRGRNVETAVRRSRGLDIAAACGQLRTERLGRRLPIAAE